LLPEHRHTVNTEPALERKGTPTDSSSRTWAHGTVKSPNFVTFYALNNFFLRKTLG
jgi:hypothetical protein